jgi:hypothetical protein
MEEKDHVARFCEKAKQSFGDGSLIKITLGKPSSKARELKNIFIRPVVIRDEKKMSVLYRYPTKDITKNLTVEETAELLKELSGTEFLHISLFTRNYDIRLMFNKKRKSTLLTQKPSLSLLQPVLHNRIKAKLISVQDNVYLQKLGVLNSKGEVAAGMNNKFRQINRYVEILDGALPEKVRGSDFTVVDMGSGKGYLTFALYDHLHNNLKVNITMTGVEMRGDLVALCNDIARDASFDGLTFAESNISEFDLPAVDMLIALHACDTATDDAIFKGIKAGAQYIVVAPCCQKQIRKQMHPENELKPILKHGIFLERQAEMLTDGLRALILEKYGYRVKVVEFVPSEHTPKNVMLIASKSKKKQDEKTIDRQIHQIKKAFGIEYHYLEKLLDKA